MHILTIEETYALFNKLAQERGNPVVTEEVFRAALEKLGDEHLYPYYKEVWHTNPFLGNCQVVSEFVFRYLAEEGTQIYAIDSFSQKESEHWYCKNIEKNYIIDLTNDGRFILSATDEFKLLQGERLLCKKLAEYMGYQGRLRKNKQARFGQKDKIDLTIEHKYW